MMAIRILKNQGHSSGLSHMPAWKHSKPIEKVPKYNNTHNKWANGLLLPRSQNSKA